MRRTILATVATFTIATAVNAGGLIIYDDPVVAAPPAVVNPWIGAYAGLTYGNTSASRTVETVTPQFTTDYEDIYGTRDIYERDITEEWYEKLCENTGNLNSHNGNKCGVTAFDWANSPEIDALPEEDKWGNRNDLQFTPHRYDEGYTGIWMDGTRQFTFTTPNADNSGRSNKGANTNVVNSFTKILGTEEVASDVVGARFVRTVETDEVVGQRELGTRQVGETVTTERLSTSENTFGGFLGYRGAIWDNGIHGALIGGIEGNLAEDYQTAEVQMGWGTQSVLPYLFVGYGNYNSDIGNDNGATYGIGTDIMFGGGWLLGAKYTKGDFGDIDADITTFRVGYRF